MKQQKHLFDNPKNVTLLIRVLTGCCVVLFVLDFILHRHSVHPMEWIPGFYPVYGFIGCVVLVVIAKWMRNIIMRSEDYYQDKAEKPHTETDTHRSDHAAP